MSPRLSTLDEVMGEIICFLERFLHIDKKETNKHVSASPSHRKIASFVSRLQTDIHLLNASQASLSRLHTLQQAISSSSCPRAPNIYTINSANRRENKPAAESGAVLHLCCCQMTPFNPNTSNRFIMGAMTTEPGFISAFISTP